MVDSNLPHAPVGGNRKNWGKEGKTDFKQIPICDDDDDDCGREFDCDKCSDDESSLMPFLTMNMVVFMMIKEEKRIYFGGTIVCQWCTDDDRMTIIEHIQGDPKKTIHSVLYLRSVVEVQFYFFTGVSEPEFRARFTWSPYWCPFRIRKASKMPSHTQFSLYLHSLGDSEVLLFLPSSPDNAPAEVEAWSGVC